MEALNKANGVPHKTNELHNESNKELSASNNFAQQLEFEIPT